MSIKLHTFDANLAPLSFLLQPSAMLKCKVPKKVATKGKATFPDSVTELGSIRGIELKVRTDSPPIQQ